MTLMTLDCENYGTFRIMVTQRLHSGSFLGLPYRILYMNLKKELLWSLGVMQDLDHQPQREDPEN